MPKAIVSDKSCLILFSKIDELTLLKKLFGKVFITEVVSKEFGADLPQWIEVANPTIGIDKGFSIYLDAGEASSIALAYELQDSLLIIDEAKGRNVAKSVGVSITGSLGVIVAAKNKGYLNAVLPVIKKSKKLISGFQNRCFEKYWYW